MTKKRRLVLAVCPICGARLEKGERVRVMFHWEYERTGTLKSGGEYKYAAAKSTSRCVCRECGMKLADEVGAPVIEEVV